MNFMDNIYNLLPYLKGLLVISAIVGILALITNGFKFKK